MASDQTETKEEGKNNIILNEYTSSIQSLQRKTFLDFLNKQDLADVTFKIGSNETEYNINRIFLSIISPVFRGMLFGQMSESKLNSDVIIEDMKPETFECIINFAYCNNPKISSKNVLSLIKACDKYQITSLLGICYDFFRSCLSKHFCTYFYEALNLNIFQNKTREIMESHFNEHYAECLDAPSFCKFFIAVNQLKFTHFVEKSIDFLKGSDFDSVKQILEDDVFLQIPLEPMRLILQTEQFEATEEMIWTAVVKWADYLSQANDGNLDDFKSETDDNGKDKKVYLLRCVKDLIRFGIMNEKYFVDFVEPENILTDKELIKVFMFYIKPERGCGSFITKQRVLIGKSLIYTLKMSSKYQKGVNTFDAMVSNDLNQGGVTNAGTNEFIQASLSNKCYVTHVDVGAPGSNMGYSNSCINKAVLKYRNDNKWISISVLTGFEAGRQKRYKLNKKVQDIRVIFYKKSYTLALGKLEVFGWLC